MPISDGTDTDAANTMASVPDNVVMMPDAANRAGTSGVASRSRMIQVCSRYQAAAIRVTPDNNLAAPLRPYIARLFAIATIDFASDG